jgi:gluconolactonase
MRIFCDGMTTEPRLAHPEGVAVHPDGSVWCGGEQGQIYRISPDGSEREQVASTSGFCLGLAFDTSGDLFVCDLAARAVVKLDAKTGKVERFADGAPGHRLVTPNYPAFDHAGRLYVSDSGTPDRPAPGILRFDPDGTSELWDPGPFSFANGLAFNPSGDVLYVVETWRYAITAIEIGSDGEPAGRKVIADLPGVLPDGLAVADDGTIYVGCYEPSRIMRIRPGGRPEVFADDPTAHLLCHPTNVAFQGTTLIAANLGRWHLAAVETGQHGLPLPPTPASLPLPPTPPRTS